MSKSFSIPYFYSCLQYFCTNLAFGYEEFHDTIMDTVLPFFFIIQKVCF
jgi:hypothetical protein